MIYIGCLYHISTKEIDFRNMLLENQIDSFNFDGVPNYARRRQLHPRNSIKTTIIFENLNYSKKFFIYSMHIYEDINGVLYDTIHLDVISFEDEPNYEDYGLKPNLSDDYYSNEQYNKYNEEEILKLKRLFEIHEHPLANIIDNK